MSPTEACSGDASKGGTLATGFCTLAGAAGAGVGLGGSSGAGAGGATAGAGAGAGAPLALLENRLAHDLPGAGCGCGGSTGGAGSPRLRGVGGGGKSDAVGAGGGGCGAGGGSGAAAPLREWPNGALFVTISGGPAECSVMEIGMGALLGGRGGSRLAWSPAGALLSTFSLFSLDGERLVGPSRFCLLPKGALGVEAACCTGTTV